MQRILLSVAALLGLASAGFRTGKCLNPKLQDNFEIEKYVGVWYEQYRDYDFAFSDPSGECTVAEYSFNDDGSVKVHNSQYITSNKTLDDTVGRATCDGAQCQVRFSQYQPFGDYRVVSVDYDEYTIIYSCDALAENFKLEDLWILGREREIEPTRLAELKTLALEKLQDYDESQMRRTYQGDECEYVAQF